MFTQAVALLLVALVAPLTLHGAVAALAISGSTHAVIDRRWIVRAIIRAKGCHNWPEAPYLIRPGRGDEPRDPGAAGCGDR